MSHSDRLNIILSDLENQAVKFADSNNVLAGIATLKDEISNSLSLLKENNLGFLTISGDMKDRLQQLAINVGRIEDALPARISQFNVDNKESHDSLQGSMEAGFLEQQSLIREQLNLLVRQVEVIDTALPGRIQEFNIDNERLHSDLDKSILAKLDVFFTQLAKLELALQGQIGEFMQENRAFARDLDSSLVSRLDKHKSDIQVEIRNESSQTQRVLELSMNTIFNSLESKIKDRLSAQETKIDSLKSLLFTSIAIGIVIGVLLTYHIIAK